jgi:CubicO group peptidase (beta-lactamase class C family)
MKWSLIKRKLARVERVLDKSIDRAELPGAVVLARMPRHGEVVEFFTARGHAVVRPERIPMSRETVFDLASLTKPIATTTAVMLLVADGAFGLDDPVAAVLPVFAERDKEQVTFRHLLTHSAGLKPWRGFHELLIEKQRKTGERLLGTPEGCAWIVDRVLRSGLVHEVGVAAVYGDLDFIALGAAVEKVSGQTLDVFCEERIFGPLGLALPPVPDRRGPPPLPR